MLGRILLTKPLNFMKNSSKINICVITDAWQPVWGGGQEHIWQVYQNLAKTGAYTITILAPNLGPKDETYFDGNLRILRLGPKFTFPNIVGRTIFLLSVLNHELTHSYDFYHSHASDAILLPLVKLVKPQANFAYTVHGAGVNLVGGGLLNFFKLPHKLWTWLVFSYVWDILFTAAKSTITQPVKAKDFQVVGNGVILSDFKVKVPPPPKNTFTLIWVGRLADPVKGFSFLESAFAILSAKNPTFNLKVVTNSPHAEVIKALKQSNLFVLSSLSEGLPLVLLEAMAAKLPIITTDVGDAGELIRNAKAGLVVKPGDAAELASGIMAIYKANNRATLGINGFNYLKDRYTWPKVAKIYAKAYQK